MTTYYEAFKAKQREKERANPFLDMGRQILVPSEYFEDDVDSLRVRDVLLLATDGTPFWGTDPRAYDTVIFAKNIILPGVCRMTGKGFAQRLQRDRPPGKHGTSVKQLGIQAAKFEIHVRMWTEEHLRNFEKLVPLLKQQRFTVEETTEAVGFTGNANGAGFTGSAPAVKKKYLPAGPQPFDVYHPMLQLFRIRAAHVLEVSFPSQSHESQDVFECRIECEEHVHKAASSSAVKNADKALEIVESNPLIGKTAGTRALEAKKPSTTTKAGGGSFGGTNGAGGW